MSTTPKRAVEVRSIDYIPHAERRGAAWHQAPFWFTGNFLFGTLLLGFIGPGMGLSLSWTIMATVLGVLFGTFFMAFHANQGPTMGLAQMIQSRAQFGVRGALVPMAAVIFSYIGFAVFGTIFAGDALQRTVGLEPRITYIAVTVLSAAIAVFGYNLLHVIMRWLTFIVVPTFMVVTIGALFTLSPAPFLPTSSGGSTLTLGLLQFGVAAGYQIGYAVYVSDYSRYLPVGTSHRAIIGWTYLGSALSACWMASLGALIAWSLPDNDAMSAVQTIGDNVINGFGDLAVLAIVPSTIGATAVCFYSSTLSLLSISESFGVRSTGRGARTWCTVFFASISLAIVFAIPSSYLDSFNTFLMLLLYVLVPWSSVNLVDFYFVRKGRYAIAAIFDPNGIYGRWGTRGLVAYFAGVLAMIPFVSLPIYVGPVANFLDGADLAFFVGLVVSGGVYAFLMRGFDPECETGAIRQSAALLEKMAYIDPDKHVSPAAKEPAE